MSIVIRLFFLIMVLLMSACSNQKEFNVYLRFFENSDVATPASVSMPNSIMNNGINNESVIVTTNVLETEKSSVVGSASWCDYEIVFSVNIGRMGTSLYQSKKLNGDKRDYHYRSWHNLSESSVFEIVAYRPYGDTQYGITIEVPVFSSEFSYSKYQDQAGDISVKYTFPADFSEYDKFAEFNEQCNVSLIVEFGDFSYIR